MQTPGLGFPAQWRERSKEQRDFSNSLKIVAWSYLEELALPLTRFLPANPDLGWIHAALALTAGPRGLPTVDIPRDSCQDKQCACVLIWFPLSFPTLLWLHHFQSLPQSPALYPESLSTLHISQEVTFEDVRLCVVWVRAATGLLERARGVTVLSAWEKFSVCMGIEFLTWPRSGSVTFVSKPLKNCSISLNLSFPDTKLEKDSEFFKGLLLSPSVLEKCFSW